MLFLLLIFMFSFAILGIAWFGNSCPVHFGSFEKGETFQHYEPVTDSVPIEVDNRIFLFYLSMIMAALVVYLQLCSLYLCASLKMAGWISRMS